MGNKYKNEKFVKKTFNICGILQCLYYLGCIIVMICMPLYTAFYLSAFSELCVTIGAVMTMVSTFNPVGLLAWICILITFSFDHAVVRSKKIKTAMIIWLVLSPILQLLCWIGAVGSFVTHTGGV